MLELNDHVSSLSFSFRFGGKARNTNELVKGLNL